MYTASRLPCQQFAHGFLDALALVGRAEPGAEFAAGYSDADIVAALLAETGEFAGCALCRRLASVRYVRVQGVAGVVFGDG